MKPVAQMTHQEKVECLENMRTFIESAVESEQDSPADFKHETELRINFACTCIRDMLDLPEAIP
jgi:hypothetical protein